MVIVKFKIELDGVVRMLDRRRDVSCSYLSLSLFCFLFYNWFYERTKFTCIFCHTCTYTHRTKWPRLMILSNENLEYLQYDFTRTATSIYLFITKNTRNLMKNFENGYQSNEKKLKKYKSKMNSISMKFC